MQLRNWFQVYALVYRIYKSEIEFAERKNTNTSTKNNINMENEPGKLQRSNAFVGNVLKNYRITKAPCHQCIQFKEMIERQNQLITEMMADQTILRENLSKLQATTENQNKVIVEMMADQKVQLQAFNKTRQDVTAITTAFPLKTEEDLQKMEAEINEINEEKYVSAVKYLLDGSAPKNLERIFSREVCMIYNTDGNFGKKSLRSKQNIFKIVLAAVSHTSPNAEKELRIALQTVKKRHFRHVSNQKKKIVN
ncbi:uncharacterized protein LOC118733834 isoform X1 [Rhagoletis pomonella]|uniref:uncharacterized protein LOC118733834 isoform X1 n=2 Tax=Rhagoletis pomonella TaxID=28610 RepID=UPI0017868E83|nr:uncharacterized protein LOC118733834 isoform X1 [Rhagoletis pomonella]